MLFSDGGRNGQLCWGENNRVGGRPPRICVSYWGNPIEESQEWTSNSVQSSTFGLSSVLAIDDECEVGRRTRKQLSLAKLVVSFRKVFLIPPYPTANATPNENVSKLHVNRLPRQPT